jgi:hypothetical protein
MDLELASVDTIEKCAAISREATGVAIAALLTRSICAGRAQAIAGRGDRATYELATAFGCSKKTIERLGAIYREVIKPRIESGNTQFMLEEQGWYSVAVQAAPIVERPAVELLEEAEAKKSKDQRFTATKWKRELVPPWRNTTSEGKKLWSLLKKLAKWDDLDIREAVEGADPRALLDTARDALVAARTALELLEERAKGRIEP